MWTWRIYVTLVLLILPARSDRVITTCEIPSVEAGDNATMTIHFSEDLAQKRSMYFSILHLSHSATESDMLTCVFSNGDVKCDQTPCCTWESKVTDIFRVYIHNASQQLEGKFWAYVIPTDVSDQRSCNFTLKASTCLTDSITATNSHMTCNNQSVTIGQSCIITCYSGYYFHENQTSVTYTCVGKNKWSPDISVTYCEAYTCPLDVITAENSHVYCSDKVVTIGQNCTMTCNSDHYFQENHTSMTYTCVGKNKWSPEIPVISCEAHSKDLKVQNLYFLFLLLSALPIFTVVVILFKRRHKEETKRKNKEDPLLPLKSTELQASKQSVEDYWLECIRTWYPELQSRTYFLPPFHFNRVSYGMQIVAGNQVLVPQNPQDNDVRDDRALERVLQCLRALADDSLQKEVMMVVSQLQFGKYLGEPSYAAAAALLPSPSKLPRYRYDKGDCDVLIIHSKLGLLTLEIKSVGGNFSQREMTEQEQDDVLLKEVKRAVKQLNKAEVVLKHLTSECIATTHITKILVLSNIKSSQLLRAVNRTPDGQFLCQCFGVQNTDDAVKLCLLSDQLSDKHMSSDGNHCSHQALREWWQHIVKASGSEQLMTSSLYEQLVASYGIVVASNSMSLDQNGVCHTIIDLVLSTSSCKGQCCVSLGTLNTSHRIHVESSDKSRASSYGRDVNKRPKKRFCGPATTVEVHCVTAPRLNIRTLGEAVSETGERVARLVLFPQQVDILNQSPPGAFLFGPPGTGKTIVLIMQALTWLQRGHDVHVVSTWYGSRAATIVMEHQLQETVKKSTARSCVHRHQFEIWKDGEVKTAVRRLKSLSEGRQLCVIADEVVRDYSDYRKSFTKFCDQLIVQVPGVFIWGASVYHEVRPLCLEEVKLTTPLRSPPVVVREVMESWKIKNEQVHDYTVSDVPVPTDGPPVMRIEHRDGQSGHTGDWSFDCVECGHQVARVLTELDVGRRGDSNGPPPLQYRDVLVLCNDYPTDDRVKCFGLKTTTASGLVRGLHERHVPMRVVEKGDETAIRDMALGVGDLVMVANWRDVLGLERKVVVVQREIEGFDRLLAISRCTSQLVVIDWRPVLCFHYNDDCVNTDDNNDNQ